MELSLQESYIILQKNRKNENFKTIILFGDIENTGWLTS